MSKLKFLLCSLLFCLNTYGQEQLDRYVKTAAENNPHLKSLFNKYMAALEKVPQVGALPEPQLAFGYFIQPIETRVGPQRAKLSISQMFPWFGTLNAQQRVAAQMAQARFEDFKEAKYKLFYELKSTYYTLYVLEQAIRITAENINLLATFKKLALIKFESGVTSMVDELRVEMEMAELDNQLSLLKDNKLPLQARFYELLNRKEKITIVLPDSLWADTIHLSKDALYDSILTKSPALQKLEAQVLSWGNKITVAKKSGMPSFTIGADYINVGQGTDVNIANNGKDAILLPTIGLKIPLYRSKYKAMIKEARFNEEAVQLEKTDLQNKLLTHLEKGYRDYLDAKRRITLYQHLSILARQAMDILITGYATAGKDFEEILRMERMILKYALELEKARADQNTAVAFLQYLMGE